MSITPYPLLHRLGRVILPNCLWGGNGSVPVVTLTFDDGPHPEYTPALLDVLARHGVSATFFLLGDRVVRFPSVVRRIHEAGHQIGLHGYHHHPFLFYTPGALRSQLTAAQTAIADACGLPLDTVRYVRPPYGLATAGMVTRLREWGFRPVMWGTFSEDGTYPGVEIVVRRTLDQTQAGSLIVLHDGIRGGQAVAQVADALIPALSERGYGFVTVDALWQ